MSQAAGLTSTLEVFAALQLLGHDYAAIMADGKVDVSDLGQLAVIFTQYPTFAKAVADAKGIPAEFSDLSEDEVLALAKAAFAAVVAFKGK